MIINDEYEYELNPNIAAVIPAKTTHKIINNSTEDSLKLYSIYSYPTHEKDLVETTKPETLTIPEF